MQESKGAGWVGECDSRTDTTPDRETGLHGGDSADADGWQQYRKWISKAPAPRGRRGSVDPSLYTWKGYRSWSEQVKRNWTDN